MEPQNIVNLSQYLQSFWLPIFKNHTFKTRIIKTNLKFLQYLSSDGIFIHPKYRKPHPKDQNSLDIDIIEENQSKNLKPPVQISTLEAISNKNNEDFSSNPDYEHEELSYFPEFDQEIEKAFMEFDHKVFVKLNWKAPRDIDTWVPRLQCSNIEDVFMCLKSSSIIGEMLENCCPKPEELKKDKDLEESGGLELILRKWYELNKAMEFRVFIKNEKIRAISQRYMKNSYKFLIDKDFQSKIKAKIVDFVMKEILGKFPDSAFTLDLYIEVKKLDNWRLWIVDFNPWGNFTNPLLFDWEDLEKDSQELEMKVISKDNEIVLEKNTGICQMPIEFQGEMTEENMKKWLETLNEDKASDIE